MELNTKLIVLTLVLALTLTATTGQICNMTYDGLNSCKPYVQTKNPLSTEIDPKGPCCTALSPLTKADFQCLCKQRNNPFVRGIDFDLAAKLPEKCGLPAQSC